MSNSDVHIITGYGSILNPENIAPGINLEELERSMINSGLIQARERDPRDRFNDDLRAAADKLGISFNEFTEKKKPQATPFPKTIARPPDDEEDIACDTESSEDCEDNDVVGGSMQSTNIPAAPLINQPANQSTYNQPTSNHSTYNQPTAQPTYNQPSTNRFSDNDRPRFGSSANSELQLRTQEHRRDHIDSVMGITSGDSFSFEKEKREDVKCAMLAEIDSLISSLSDGDVDISRIPKVDRNSDYGEVESVLRMLRHKNDHTRYCSFAEEFMLFGAYAMEDLFDGKRTWFGRYNPDLTGWHNHVNIKLKRMRHDTGQLVSTVMQDYNIGPGLRVLLELVPNMILYSKMRKQQHSEPGLFSEEEMAGVTQNLRNNNV